MNWQEVCENSDLQNLPFKIELNERGQILMSPVEVYHSAFQGKIVALLHINIGRGEILTECAIKTDRGAKVADVAWSSSERFKTIRTETECSIAPEICVEVVSEGNIAAEMSEKRMLYFARSVLEVWICDEHGRLKFYDNNGELDTSRLTSNFPRQI
jgi:Uma2 family endonuclease